YIFSVARSYDSCYRLDLKKREVALTRRIVIILLFLASSASVFAQVSASARLHGRITDQTGAVLPGVTVELRSGKELMGRTVTADSGEYSFPSLARGIYELGISLVNFAPIRRDVSVAAGDVEVNAILRVTLSSEISVTTKSTFFNLADIENPAEN